MNTYAALYSYRNNETFEVKIIRNDDFRGALKIAYYTKPQNATLVGLGNIGYQVADVASISPAKITTELKCASVSIPANPTIERN